MGSLEYYQQSFAANLKWQMSKNGVRQQDIIDALGVPSGSVSAWCAGTRIPRMDKIQMLADYFGIAVSDLLEDRTEEMQDELFEQKQLLFDKVKDATPETMSKILQIVDMLIDDK